MKSFTVEYLGYRLEIEIQDKYLTSDKSNQYPYIKGTCNELDSFVKSGYYENYLPIVEEFMRVVDLVVKSKEEE